eukprot:3201578-Prymnesium_polylepis.1
MSTSGFTKSTSCDDLLAEAAVREEATIAPAPPGAERRARPRSARTSRFGPNVKEATLHAIEEARRPPLRPERNVPEELRRAYCDQR